PDGRAGQPYTYTFTASGAPAPSFALTSGTLPPGLLLDGASGVLAGTPTGAGAYGPITVTASNEFFAPDATRTFTLTIAPADATPPVITMPAGPNDAAAAGGWYNTASSGSDAVEVDVSATDASGVAQLMCGDGQTTLLDTTGGSGSFTLTDGTHEISCTASDGLGNSGAGEGSTGMPDGFKGDQTAPAPSPTVSPSPNQARHTSHGTVP